MKHIFYIIFVLSSLLLSNCSQQIKIDCGKFKKGVFFYRDEIGNRLYKIKRNDSIQIETLIKTGDNATLKINWIGPCEYELTFLSQHVITTDSFISSTQKNEIKN